MKNYKTTLSGIGVICAALGNAITEYLAGGFPAVNIPVLIAGLSTGIGLLFAKDMNVTGGTVPQASSPEVTAVKAAEVRAITPIAHNPVASVPTVGVGGDTKIFR
jgi:hypothetical protein